MTVTSGFFNSVSSDRKYDAEQLSSLFNGVITDGVFSTVGGSLLVSASSGMNVSVAAGRAWFLETWINNSEILGLGLNASSPTLDRIDTVVLDIDKSDGVRNNSIIILEGVPSPTPIPLALVDDLYHKQYELGRVLVAAAVTDINSGDITNMVGTAGTPFATGLLTQVSAGDLIDQWDYEFHEWLNGLIDDLGTDPAAALQAQIDELKDILYSRPGRNLIINGDMRISQREDVLYPQTPLGEWADFEDYPYYGPDRWNVAVINNGATLQYYLTQVFENGRFWSKFYPETPDAIAASTKVQLRQAIEVGVLDQLAKGTADARPMTLSFLVKASKSGDFGLRLWDRQNHRHCVRSYNIPVANVETYISVSISADFVGELTTILDTGLQLEFIVAAGSNLSASPIPSGWEGSVTNDDNIATGNEDIGANANDYIQFTDVQLEVGDILTPFEFVDDATLLASCLRYYEKIESKNVLTMICGEIALDEIQIDTVTLKVPKLMTNWAAYNLYLGVWSFSTGHIGSAGTQEIIEKNRFSFKVRASYDIGAPAGTVTSYGVLAVDVDSELRPWI